MQKTSDIYKQIISGPHAWETSLVIGEKNDILSTRSEILTVGGEEIALNIGGADIGYKSDMIFSVSSDISVFPTSAPTAGGCVSRELNATVMGSLDEIARAAKVIPFVRCKNSTQTSEWIQKGVFFIDTRTAKKGGNGTVKTELTAYDGMMKLEIDFPQSTREWPATDREVVTDILAACGLEADDETMDAISNGFLIEYPVDFSCREVLQNIASMYAACFIMDDLGRLKMIQIV